MYLEFYIPRMIWDTYTEKYRNLDRKIKAFLEPNIIYDKEIKPRIPSILKTVLKAIVRKIYGKALGVDLKIYHFDKDHNKVYHVEHLPDGFEKEQAKIKRFIVAHRIFNTHILFTYSSELDKIFPKFPVKLEEIAREVKSVEQFSKIYNEYKKIFRKTIFPNDTQVKTYCPLEAIGRIQTTGREIISFNTLYNYCLAKFIVEDPIMAVLEENTKIISDEIKIDIKIKLEEFEEKIIDECESIQESIEMILMEIDSPYSLAKAMLQQEGAITLDLSTIRKIKNAGFTIDEFVEALRHLENHGYAVYKDGKWIATDRIRVSKSISVDTEGDDIDSSKEDGGDDLWDWESWI